MSLLIFLFFVGMPITALGVIALPVVGGLGWSHYQAVEQDREERDREERARQKQARRVQAKRAKREREETERAAEQKRQEKVRHEEQRREENRRREAERERLRREQQERRREESRKANEGGQTNRGRGDSRRGTSDRERDRSSSTQPNAGSAHEILEVAPNASEDEIRAAYRKLVQMYHPDKVSGLGPEFGELAERRMKEINAAYAKLRPKKMR